jgi:hypothetical protein
MRAVAQFGLFALSPLPSAQLFTGAGAHGPRGGDLWAACFWLALAPIGDVIARGRPEELERQRHMLGQAEETGARLGGGLVSREVAECRTALAAISE